MKKVDLFFMKSLVTALICFSVVSCNESGQEIPVYDMRLVSKYERDALTTHMSNDGKKITGYTVDENNTYKYTATVAYKTGSIYCEMDGVHYLVGFDNTIGGSRVKELTATVDNALYYKVIYFYDDLGGGRLSGTEVNVAGGTNTYYTTYEYTGSSIIIREKMTEDRRYEIALGDEENTGYIYNVLGNSEAPLTAQYVFNPELYFLNIYGRPVDKLPQGLAVERSGNTMRVDKHYYEYR
jgi:hypothetical protein